MLSEKTRKRILYDKTNGKLYQPCSDEPICPIRQSSGLSRLSQPCGYSLEDNKLQLCEASANSPGVVFATEKKGNISFGRESLGCILNGVGNSVFGRKSAPCIVDGCFNSVFGFSSFQKSIDSSFNVSVGSNSLLNFLSGKDNVIVGSMSTHDLVNGNGNVFLGSRIKAGGTDTSRRVVIGDEGVGERDNELLVSETINSVRMRALSSTECSDSGFLSFNHISGTISPISYPMTKGNLPLLTSTNLLDIRVFCSGKGKVVTCLEDAAKVPFLSIRNKDGDICGINHNNFMFLLLFCLQTLEKKTEKQEKVSEADADFANKLSSSLGEFSSETFKKFSYLENELEKRSSETMERFNKENSELKNIVIGLGKTEEENYLRILGILEKQEKEKLSLFGELKDMVISLGKTEEKNCSGILNKTREEYDKKIGDLTKENNEIQERLSLLEEQMQKLCKKEVKCETRPLSPLETKTNGELRRRIPVDKLLEEWENL